MEEAGEATKPKETEVTAEAMSGRKRKADALGRLAASVSVFSSTSSNATTATSIPIPSSSKAGRGALVGWTVCPLCAQKNKKKKTQKRLALGRGIAAHLHAVHTPWKNKNEETQREEREPTEEEVKQWEETVLEIVQQLEQEARCEKQETLQTETENSNLKPSTGQNSMVDRTGKQVKRYRDSLPPFIAAAASGELATLQKMVQTSRQQQEQNEKEQPEHDAVYKLLQTRDRHRSTAQHWAAGEGHLKCLEYLCQLEETLGTNGNPSEHVPAKKVRRRDGKTALHYAARKGQLACAKYLLQFSSSKHVRHHVDEKSGDGTTPLHLACFGGHLEMVRLLVETHGANPHEKNDWKCGVSHWVGMARASAVEGDNEIDKKERKDRLWELCRVLQQDYKVDFVQRQAQGHTALHKAAQSQNEAVVTWLAADREQGGAGLDSAQKKALGGCDAGGHTASDIWLSVGGDANVATWMKEQHGW